MTKKSNNPRIILSFRERSQCLHFYKNLPANVQNRCKLFSTLSCLSIQKADYHQLKRKAKERFPVHTVQKDTKYKTHAITSRQVIPWGIRRVAAPLAWPKTTGRGVKIGVIDTGIDGRHPDLRANIKGGTNTIDQTGPFKDLSGHGTHISGTIAALNNSFGVVGVAPTASIYSLKCFNALGEADLTDIVEAIEWAINNKMDILNMSFGAADLDPLLHLVIKKAYRRGILLIASAGNENGPIDFPARFPEVIAVGAINQNNRVAPFSNFGPSLDFVEPGVNILSTSSFPPYYERLSGTSMSTPHLVGLSALLLSLRPSLTPNQVKNILTRSATRIPNTSSLKQGAGIVTARGLVRFLSSSRKKIHSLA